MSRLRVVGLVGIGLVCGLLTLAPAASPAFAHDAIVRTDPAPDSTVSTATQIALTFTGDPVGGAGADIVQVTGPDGRYYETACPALAGPVATAPVALGPAGRYEVRWRVVSSDGHPVSGAFSFGYRPEATSPAAVGAATPRCGDAAPTAPAPQPAVPAGGLWTGLGIAAAVAAAAAAGAWLLLRPRAADAPTGRGAPGSEDRGEDSA